MHELTAENVIDYCRRLGWLRREPAHAELLGGGVSNAVFRISGDDTLFVLKQSRPQLRTRDPWFSDIDRVWREMKVMQRLHPLLPPWTVPEVLHHDDANFAFAMSHAPLESRVWKESLLAGDVDLAVARHAGLVLGRLHQRAAEQIADMAEFADRTVFDQLRIDPFYRRIQERRPEVAASVAMLIGELETRRESLCHGDFSPKNILTHSHGFTLVDYETAHVGDPTMDLGFFLSHLLLKGCRHVARRREFFSLTEQFWTGYTAEVIFRPMTELQSRAIGHLGLCLLARIDGTSPVDYLPEPSRREAVRNLGRSLLLDRPAHWADVLGIAERQYSTLEV
jgi:5-methylthioribose kinase